MRIVADPASPGALELDDDLVVSADNAAVLERLPAGAFDLIYVDPPFNTGRTQRRRTLEVVRDDEGDRFGFGGATRLLRGRLDGLRGRDHRLPRLSRAPPARGPPAARPHGTLYVHLDYREAHYVKLLLDEIFGRECFLNELIWAYDYGAKPKRRWPAKHDTILVYVRTPGAHHFDADAVEREPYMAPGLVTAEKAARGKLPTDVIWHTIVSPTGREEDGLSDAEPEVWSAASSRRRRGRAAGAWTSSPARARSARSARSSGAATCWWTQNPEAVAVMAQRLDRQASAPAV